MAGYIGKIKNLADRFIDLQSALAIDILLIAPVRMKNSRSSNSTSTFCGRWGRGSRRVIVFKSEETKNKIPLEFELPLILSDRLHVYRNKIAPMVTGRRPGALF